MNRIPRARYSKEVRQEAVELAKAVGPNELVYPRRFATREQAKREITEYIEVFYNRRRRQARLGYLSPAAFMQQYRQQHDAA